MFKKLVILLVLALFSLAGAGTARAALTAFADLELIRIYYDRSGTEIGTDLGKVRDLTAGGTSTIPGSFGSLSTGYVAYFSLDRTTNQLWASGSSSASSVILGGGTGLTSLKSGTTTMYTWYNGSAVDGQYATYTGLASATSSYKNKLSATQGWLANSITTRANTEASISGLLGTGSGSVTQLLYFWNNGLTTLVPEKTGVPAATIITYANGSTQISPPPPGAPAIETITPGNGQVTVEFSAAPLYTGAGAVTGYTVTAVLADGSSSAPQGTDQDAGTTSLSHVVTGLQNDTTYTLKVAATNAAGTGPASAASAGVTPTAPTGFTVTYDGNGSTGGTAPADPGSPYLAGTTVTVLDAATLVRTGYSFAGWNTAADGTGTGYAPGATFTIAQNSTLFAQWSLPSRAVSYDGNTSTGGSAPVDPGTPYASGSRVTVLDAGTLVKAGYSFSGWNTAADGSGTGYASGATFTIAQETTLFAQWSALPSYGVSYDGNAATGGAAPADPGSPYLSGSTVTVLGAGTLVRTGYSFAGWNTQANGSGTSYAPGATFAVNGATTLHAQWSINSYTVSFDSNGGSAVPSQSVTYATAAASPTPPSKTGSTFAGWYADIALAAAFDFASPITGDTTLYAGWTLNSYTVTPSVTSGSGSITPALPQAVSYGSTTTFTVSPDSGYTASVGGTCRGTLAGATYYTTEPVATDCSVEVVFTQNPRTVTVTGGSHGKVSPTGAVTVPEGAGLNVAVTPDAGYEASVTGSCVGSLANNIYSIAAVSADCSVQASFSIKSYTVAASVTGGVGSITQPDAPIAYGASVTLTITPGTGYHLVALTDNGVDVTASVVSGGYTLANLNANHTVTASFAIDTKTVSASVSGGSGSVTPSNSSVDYGGSVTLSVTPAAGYHLAALTDNGTDVSGAVANGSYSITGVKENHSVVAAFAIDTFTVTASANGQNGSITPGSSSVNYGGSANLAVTPAAGFHLAALTDNGNDVTGAVANGFYSITGVKENHTVVAIFRGITFTVTPGAGANGAISPAAPQTVDAGKSFSFTVTPDAGYQVASVTGCGGSLSGNSYSTAGIVANCSVSATFVAVPSLKGDLNDDETLDLADALLALQYAAGIKVQTSAVVAKGDVAPIVNGQSVPDRKLDITDAVALLRRSVGQLSW